MHETLDQYENPLWRLVMLPLETDEPRDGFLETLSSLRVEGPRILQSLDGSIEPLREVGSLGQAELSARDQLLRGDDGEERVGD